MKKAIQPQIYQISVKINFLWQESTKKTFACYFFIKTLFLEQL